MRLLTINTGSSSLKAALYQVDAGRAVALGGECRADRAPRLLYLLEKRHLTATQLSVLVNERSGLRDLLEREATDPRAAEAIELFCFQARKFLGALATVLGGLDTLIFTGGIGEHAAPIPPAHLRQPRIPRHPPPEPFRCPTGGARASMRLLPRADPDPTVTTETPHAPTQPASRTAPPEPDGRGPANRSPNGARSPTQPGRGSAKLLRRLVLLTLGLLALGGGTIVGYRWWQAADLGGANAAVTAQLYSWTQQAAAVKSFDDSFFAITIGCLLAFGPACSFGRDRRARAPGRSRAGESGGTITVPGLATVP